jgi:CheY-like chemotaxis protein
VLGGSEDSRLLLRGLLRLHRHRVLLEGPTHEGIERVPVSPDQKVLVLDAGTGKSDSSFSELQAALQGRGDLSAIVILPSADPALEAKAREAGAKTILVRPFAIRDFIQAVDSVGTPSATT